MQFKINVAACFEFQKFDFDTLQDIYKWAISIIR